MRDLKGKIAVITGAAGGIGIEITRMLNRAGVKLVLLSRNQAKLDALCAVLEGDEYLCCVADPACEADVADVFARTQERFGAPDMLLNLAGLSIPAKLDAMQLSDFEATIDANVKSAFLCSRSFAGCCSAEDPMILNVGSMAAKRANPNAPLYCTAKAALNMLSAGMQLQFKEKNIRVTTLNPGGVDTPFWGDRPVKREKMLKAIDVAEVIYFVLTRESHVAFSEINFESFLNM